MSPDCRYAIYAYPLSRGLATKHYRLTAELSLHTADNKLALLQDSSRKLLQINDSKTTVTAAPLSAAKANSSILAPPSENGKPHSILADVISSFKSKYGNHSEAPAASATANATAVVVTNDEGASMDKYMEPCTDGPVPSAYEAFVEVNPCIPCILLFCLGPAQST